MTSAAALYFWTVSSPLFSLAVEQVFDVGTPKIPFKPTGLSLNQVETPTIYETRYLNK